MIVKDITFGADASSFAPFMSMFSQGGAKPAATSSSDNALVQYQIAKMEQTQKYMLFGAVGVGFLGLMYLLLKR